MCRSWIPVILVALGLFPGAGSPARGQDVPARTQDAPARALVEIELLDGSTVRGFLVEEDESFVVIDSESMGRLRIDRGRIRTLTYDAVTHLPPAGWRTDPDANSLLLVPTPETLPAGDTYYRNFLLLFNNIGYAVTDDLNLSLMAAFPVSTDVRIVSMGAKLRLVSRDRSGVGVAAAVSGWILDEEFVSTVSALVGIGDRRRCLTGALSYGSSDGDGEVFFLLGGDVQIGRGFKLLAEYGNSGSAISDDNDFEGLINLGFRMFWEQTSFTLTGFRPLEEAGDFLAFPLAAFSAHF